MGLMSGRFVTCLRHRILQSLPICTRLCGFVLKTTLPSLQHRRNFAKKIQSAFIAILKERDKQLKLLPKVDVTHIHESVEFAPAYSEPTIHQLNPLAFSRTDLYPTYPWEWDLTNSASQKFFTGIVPDNWRRFASNAEWSYSLDLFPALVWYFRQLLWPGAASEFSVTWAELAIDFQAATHCVLQRESEPELTLEQQARLLRSAAKLVSRICSAKVVPDMDAKTSVYVLNALGLGRAAGLVQRPRFLMPEQVHKTLFHAALHPDAKKPEHKRSFIPDFSNLPKPLWAGTQRRRLRGKQPPPAEIAPPSAKRASSSHKASTQAIQWSEQELQELNDTRDWRHRVRIEKRILHNRTASQLSKHILRPFDIDDDISCSVCRKTMTLANLSRFMKETCGGATDSANPVTAGTARASVQLAKRMESVQTHNNKAASSGHHVFIIPNSLDDDLRCNACGAPHPGGWRPFGRLAKEMCSAATCAV